MLCMKVAFCGGIVWWEGQDGPKGAIQCRSLWKSNVSVLNKCFRWVLDGAAYSLFLIYAGGMLTFKQSCVEQTKEFLFKGFWEGRKMWRQVVPLASSGFIAVAEV